MKNEFLKFTYSAIVLVLLGGSAFAQLGQQTTTSALGLSCPIVCPGDILTDLELVSLDEEHPLFKKYEWAKAGCISIPYDRDMLDLSFASADGSDDIDWVLVDRNTIQGPDDELSQVLYEDHEGPLLGRSKPVIAPTALERTTLKGESEYVVFYTAWGAKAEIDLLEVQLGSYWSPESDNCFSETIKLSPNPVANQLTISITDFSNTSAYEYQIFDVKGVQLSSKREILNNEIVVDVKSFPKGYYVVSILSGENLVSSKRFLKI